MKPILSIIFGLSMFSTTAQARKIFKIEVSDGYSKYSNNELKRRVWELERAVYQLQQEVYNLQSSKSNQQEMWVCTLSPFTSNYSATGTSKAVAKSRVIQKCTRGESNGFHCKNPTCEK